MAVVQNLSSCGSKGRVVSLAPPNPILHFDFYLVLGSLFGFVSLLYAFFFTRNCHGKFEVLGLLRFDELAYNLVVLSCLSILGFSVRRLSRRCDQFQRSFSLIWAKSSQILNGLCSNGGLSAHCGSKMQSLKTKGGCETERELRRKARRERKKRKEAVVELEREREAWAWASEEAMAKIMLLESEKASVEREARQYREMMEKKQAHDEQLIDYLQLLLVQNSLWMEREGEEQQCASRSVRDEDDATWADGSDGI